MRARTELDTLQHNLNELELQRVRDDVSHDCLRVTSHAQRTLTARVADAAAALDRVAAHCRASTLSEAERDLLLAALEVRVCVMWC
jgi:hypothetical protein